MLPNLGNLGEPTGPLFRTSRPKLTPKSAEQIEKEKQEQLKEEKKEKEEHLARYKQYKSALSDASKTETMKFENGKPFSTIIGALTAGYLFPNDQLLIAAPRFSRNKKKESANDASVLDVPCLMALLRLVEAPNKEQKQPIFRYFVKSINQDPLLTIAKVAKLEFNFDSFFATNRNVPTEVEIQIPPYFNQKYIKEHSNDEDMDFYKRIRAALFPDLPNDYEMDRDFFIFRFVQIQLPVPCYKSQLMKVFTEPGKAPLCLE